MSGDEIRKRRKRIEVDPDVAGTSMAESEPLVLLRSAALIVAGERVPIPRGGLSIGSGPDADLLLERDGVSTLHATVAATGAGYVIVDKESRTGTFVNGERLVPGERHPLEPGDSIAIGGRLLHFLPAGTPQPRLARIEPVDAGRVRTTGETFTIGRRRDNDLVLDHPTVSLVHAVILLHAGQAFVEDAGGTTGVRVNGSPVRRGRVQAGDQIAIGPYRIVFDGEELVERAAPSGLPVAAFGVSVDAGGATILHALDLHLRPGELVAIIGESGAGKSTLLKALAGVVPATRGRVLLGGEDVETRLTEVGYVPQFDVVHGLLTVREALDYAARLRLPSDTLRVERARIVGSVLSDLGLTDGADRRVDRLSGGQRKRVSVGSELLHRPGVLFLDEPTTGLDPGLERRLMDLFRKLAETGQTVALVTHASGSLALCDRVVAIGRGGHLRFSGAPAALLSAYDVSTFDEVYVELARPEGPSPPPPVDSAAALPTNPFRAAAVPPIPQCFLHQVGVLAARYIRLLLRDRHQIGSALLQVGLLSLLTAGLFDADVFARAVPGEPLELFADKAAQLVFLMVTIALWLGSISAAREIVKERSVLARELALGVSVRAYVSSKLAVLCIWTAMQTLAFGLIILSIRPLDAPTSAAAGLLAVLVLAAWVGVLLGLVVSAHAQSEDHANSVIPLLLVPQLLFGGAIVPLQDMSGPVRLVADAVPARWAFAAAGDAIDLRERLAEDPRTAAAPHYGSDFFTIGMAEYALVVGLFVALLLALLAYLLRGRGPLAV